MTLSRREILKMYGLGSLGLAASPTLVSFSKTQKMSTRSIPSSGEQLPIIGVGTCQTFDVGDSAKDLVILRQVLDEMKKFGGKVIDSSPMYGSSEAVVGNLTHDPEFESHFSMPPKCGHREGRQE